MYLRRSVPGLLGVAVALLLIGVVIAVGASRQAETTYPPSTPEATIADFIRLVEAGKLNEAYALHNKPTEHDDPWPGAGKSVQPG